MPNYMVLFCEDIREEVGGSHTIVGVLPDNINIQSHIESGGTVMFPKLGIYLRINFESDRPPPKGAIWATASLGDGRRIADLGAVEEDVLLVAFADAKTNKMPFVGLIFKGVLQGLSFKESGQMVVHAVIDGEEHLCGAVNVNLV